MTDTQSSNSSSRYFLSTLSNGLRVVIRQTQSYVSYIGVVIGAGSRDEAPDRHGLAHFVEHTIFKGTSRRRAWHISNRMESIGGELNAYTSKEETVVYTNAPAGYSERALELLADIVADSKFPAAEIDREREVVIEEINSYLDSPADAVYDEFEEELFKGSPLAHNILGSRESVHELTGRDCREFLDTFYVPQNMVVYIADPTPPEKILRQVEKYFGSMHFPLSGQCRSLPAPAAQFDELRNRNGHQAHTVMGTRIFSRNDPRRFPLFLLNNYLGGPCMNSRLNQELRERRGLVYTVDSNVALLSDTGLWQVYFGSDIDNTDLCIRTVKKELTKLASDLLPQRTFDGILNQYCGQLLVSSDNRENMAMSMGKSIMYYDRILDIREITEILHNVSRRELREVAELIASSRISRLTLC